jgi:predicted RNA-binding Zn-ribbon protein involved in translation (DUF1610 family)
MMTLSQHRWTKWGAPIGLVIVAALIGVHVARAFPNIKYIGNFVVFGGIISAMLVSLIHQFLPVQCPECGAKLEYYPATHGKMPRYTCKGCGFKAR